MNPNEFKQFITNYYNTLLEDPKFQQIEEETQDMSSSEILKKYNITLQ